jgi:TolA-binding protein
LQIPVFYGAEAAFLPAADLGAAKCLARLGRLQDASDSLSRIIERYAGSPEADAAKIEKANVAKLTGAP